MEQASPELREGVLDAVRNQLRDNEPPEAKETYERLLVEGIPEEDALKLLAKALVYEMYDMMKSKRVFDQERYVILLN